MKLNGVSEPKPHSTLLTLMLRMKSVRHGLSRCNLSSIKGSCTLSSWSRLGGGGRPARLGSEITRFTRMSSKFKA
jgi:hypothetical protein